MHVCNYKVRARERVREPREGRRGGAMADHERPQETPLRLDVLFTSLPVQQLFMNYYSNKRPYVTIHSVDKNGRFQGEIASDFTVKSVIE